MKKIYKKPGMEVIDLRIQGHLLETSVGDFDDNKTGQQGGSTSSGNDPFRPGTGGTGAPEFFGGDIPEED